MEALIQRIKVDKRTGQLFIRNFKDQRHSMSAESFVKLPNVISQSSGASFFHSPPAVP